MAKLCGSKEPGTGYTCDLLLGHASDYHERTFGNDEQGAIPSRRWPVTSPTAERKQAQAMPALLPLLEAAETYRERRGTYGASERVFANVMHALFPQGITLLNHDDFVRYGLLTQMVSKLSRYARDFSCGHIDSVHDLGVYSFMLEAEDRRVQQQFPYDTPPEPPAS